MEKVICKFCGKKYFTIKSNFDRTKYCSIHCKNKARIGTKISEKQKKLISKSCIGRLAWNKGKKQSIETIEKRVSKIRGKHRSDWSGLKNSTDRHIDMNSVKYKEWRFKCLKRDNFTCQISGNKKDDKQVHHINNYADFPELRYEVDNGITMTKKIHIEFHKQYGLKNNTKEQLNEFIINYTA
jgi:hypothetical protein